MKKSLILAAFIMIAAFSFGQGRQPNVITTATPFLSINPDSRGGALGDCGVASSADVYSMHYNAAKYVFLEDKLSFGLGYSPWLRALVPDMGLFYLAGAYKINEKSAVAATIRYFNPGKIEFRDEHNENPHEVNPNEWAIDATYSRMLGDYLSGAVAGRFIYSDLTQGQADYARPGISVAADISVYYKRPVEWFPSLAGTDISWGVAINNIGSKVAYNGSSNKKDFIPTTLRLGADLGLELNEYNSLNFMVDFTKLLVPTPPIRENGEVIAGMDDDVAVVTGMIHSFYDAPGWGYASDGSGQKVETGVFLEELSEINVGGGIEYWYNNIFAVRAGYFYESPLKGSRQYVTLGAALRYNAFGLDVSYLIPTNAVAGSHPLENTLRFNLSFRFGRKKPAEVN